MGPLRKNEHASRPQCHALAVDTDERLWRCVVSIDRDPAHAGEGPRLGRGRWRPFAGRQALADALGLELFHLAGTHDIVRDPKQRTNLVGTPEGDRVIHELRAMLAALKRGESFDA